MRCAKVNSVSTSCRHIEVNFHSFLTHITIIGGHFFRLSLGRHCDMYRVVAIHGKSVQVSGVPTNFIRGGGDQQIQLRTEDRGNGDLGGGAVAP